MALFPLRAWADSDGPKRIIPRILVSSTIPANGDLNPYGVAFVPPGFPAGGPLQPGDVIGEYNIHQNQGGAFGVATSTSEEGPGPPSNDIDRLAVVNDNANDVAVTKFVLP